MVLSSTEKQVQFNEMLVVPDDCIYIWRFNDEGTTNETPENAEAT